MKGDKLTKRHATIDDIAENNESKQLTKKKKYNEPIVTANNEVMRLVKTENISMKNSFETLGGSHR